MTTQHCITEQDVRQLVSPKIFGRGLDYYRSGSVENLRRQGNKIWAICYGSSLYHLSVTLKDHSITEAHCDCPYDWGLYCKHQIALLLNYVHAPDSFQAIAPLAELLADYNREDLIQVIQRLVDAEPQLLDLLQLTPAKKQNNSINLKSFSMQAKQALQSDSVYQILHQFKPLSDYAKEFMELGDYVNAGALYCCLLEAFASQYNDLMLEIDYDGEVMCLVNDYVEGLGESLMLGGESIASGDRRKWLEQLLQVFFKDLDLGGMNYGYDALEYLQRCATDTEWIDIESYCLQRLPHLRDWGRSQVVEFLGDRLSPKNQVQFAQEHGTPTQQIWAYVAAKNYQKAQAIALANLTYEIATIKELANKLVEIGESTLALEMILKFQKRQKNPRQSISYLRWLATYSEQHNDPKSAINYSKQVLLASHDIADYRTLKKSMQRAENWDSIKPLLIKKLEQENLFPLLTDIALEEKDLDRVLNLRSKNPLRNSFIPQKIRQGKQAAQLAKERQKFDVAIALYRELAEDEISQRDRQHYAIAAKYLKEIKRIFQMKHDDNVWATYFADFVEKYKRLPALMDECKKAVLP